MPAYPRREIVDDAAVGVYHLIARCVRRARLCGFDPYTGRSCEHRKDWIRDRLQQLAAIFACDFLGFALMDNHVHLVVRNRPDLAARWSDDEVSTTRHPETRDP